MHNFPSSPIRLLLSRLWPICLASAGACGGDARPDGPPVSPPTGLAVFNSDYASASISLLDATTGAVTNGDCIDSGTRTPGTTLPLSADIALPSQPQPGNLVVTIDRTNGALTWIDPIRCTPLRQLDVSTGFFANPHDIIGVSPTKAYVTRFERNATPTPDPGDRDEGDDLLIIDPSVPKITGRIDLSGYAVAAPGATIQARPDRILQVGTQLIVALSNLSGDFKMASHGRLVLIDTATDQVTGMVDLPGLVGCASLSYMERTNTLTVACGGDFNAADPAQTSGIAYVALGASPSVERTQSVAPFGGRPLIYYSGLGADGTLGFGVTQGDFTGPVTDQFWAFDTTGGTATKLADASKRFTFGALLVDPAREVVYLPDANANQPRVHVYSYGGSAVPTLQTSIDTNPSLGLPPRAIAQY